jgi:hypothetical protein
VNFGVRRQFPVTSVRLWRSGWTGGRGDRGGAHDVRRRRKGGGQGVAVMGCRGGGSARCTPGGGRG